MPNNESGEQLKSEIRAVVFDVGGVLTASPGPVMQRRAAAVGVSMAELLPIALGPLDEDTDHPFHRAERGELSFADMVAEMNSLGRAAGLVNVPTPPTGPEMVTAMQANPDMVAFAQEVRAAGLLVGVLTNNIPEWGRWRDNVNADELAHVLIDSCEVGIRKPNPAIFRLMLDRLGGLAPAEVLFLDDFPWNVAAAAGLGIQTVHVTDTLSAIEAARSLLGWAS
jgi:putative hydrolase of the HAD superfamily